MLFSRSRVVVLIAPAMAVLLGAAPGSDTIDQQVIVVDNTDTAHVSYIGPGLTLDSAGTGYLGPNYGRAPAGTFTWTPRIPTDGDYEISALYPATANGAEHATYTVEANTAKPINQAQGGGTWISLGQYHLSAGRRTKIQLSDDNAPGDLLADAVKLVDRNTGASTIVVDNTDTANVSYIGPGLTLDSTGTGYHGTNYGRAPAGTFTWTPHIPTDGDYEISILYPATANGAQHATYTIETSTAKPINQAQGGGTWINLGQYHLSAGTRTKIQLSDDKAPGDLLADAIRLTTPDAEAASPGQHTR
jgi:hypothetical protein